MEGHFIGVTTTGESCMWRSIGNATKEHVSYMWNVTRNLNLNFVKNSSTPWHGAVDQDWRSKMCVLKHASQPPYWSALGLLSMPSQSGKGSP